MTLQLSMDSTDTGTTVSLRLHDTATETMFAQRRQSLPRHQRGRSSSRSLKDMGC